MVDDGEGEVVVVYLGQSLLRHRRLEKGEAGLRLRHEMVGDWGQAAAAGHRRQVEGHDGMEALVYAVARGGRAEVGSGI